MADGGNNRTTINVKAVSNLKSINRKERKDFRKERKELHVNDLTLRPLRQLCVLCG
jgi:hypothetical protein